jgi:putative membrane protein
MTDHNKPYTASAPIIWTGLFFIVFIWSAINPKDFPTWVLEVSPAVIGFIVLAATRKKFPLTTLAYCLILIHCWILFVGGHYTYAEVPFFDTIKETLDHSRNNYDKVGHFAQGLVPAIICRELIIRLNIIESKAFTHFFTICFCLAFSAFYELIEWWVALLTGESAVAFLGTQGYIWDTQSDMAWALIGACSALLLLSNFHDKQLQTINS